MKLIKHFSIKSKLTLIILAVTVFAVVSGFSIVLYSNIVAFKKDMVDNTVLQAKLIGEYCVSPLDFKYSAEAEEGLEKLRAIPLVTNAVVYDLGGKVFATFNKSDKTDIPFAMSKDRQIMFEGSYLYVFHTITYRDRTYGTICLKTSTDALDKKILKSLLTFCILALGLIFVSFILANRLQRVISGPILELAKVSREISEKKNYSLRVKGLRTDEIGILNDEFNNMLKRIQLHQLEHKKAQGELLESEKRFRTLMEQAPIS
ncbi:MAG: HAMP domain-containing protein, partial [bacterium]|nr:HAMP domain-containing protein [bacterium]